MGATARDAGCICHGNWRLIVGEYEALIGSRWRDSKGEVFVFFGLVWADDDFYYGLWNRDQKKLVLATCCGALQNMYEKVD